MSVLDLFLRQALLMSAVVQIHCTNRFCVIMMANILANILVNKGRK